MYLVPWLKRICMEINLIIMTLGVLSSPAYPQYIYKNNRYVDKDYQNKKYDKCRLIIAPILSLDSVSISFRESFPEIADPADSLKKCIENILQYKMRKYSVFMGLYSSIYADDPGLVENSLMLKKGDSIQVLLPQFGQKVKMVLKGSRKEADFIYENTINWIYGCYIYIQFRWDF
jgi:hypothetical protein